jgi:hypothetical protein
MASRRTAKIAFSLILDLADRLAAAGITGENAPTLDQAVDLAWPLAVQLAKLERSGKKAARSARRARAAVLDTAVARCAAAAQPRFTQWAQFDPAEWHVELVPGPSLEREREVA